MVWLSSWNPLLRVPVTPPPLSIHTSHHHWPNKQPVNLSPVIWWPPSRSLWIYTHSSSNYCLHPRSDSFFLSVCYWPLPVWLPYSMLNPHLTDQQPVVEPDLPSTQSWADWIHVRPVSSITAGYPVWLLACSGICCLSLWPLDLNAFLCLIFCFSVWVWDTICSTRNIHRTQDLQLLPAPKIN